MKNFRPRIFLTLSILALTACGGSNDSKEDSSASSSLVSSSSSTLSSSSSSISSSSSSSDGSVSIGFFVSATVAGLPENESVGITFNNEDEITATQNGAIVLNTDIESAQDYHVQVSTQPENAYCVVARGIGKLHNEITDDIRINCATETAAETAELFDSDKLHRMRLTISVEEWFGFTYSIYRSFGQSELYRIGTLEYLDANNNVLRTIPNVGFRMRGNSSRTYPEAWNQSFTEAINPARFHFNIKFDETFEDDESVYACIDEEGNPAAINNDSCWNRLVSDVPAIEENDGRTFMGVESFALKMNKDDPTYIRETLAHTILQDNNASAGRSAHASLELVIEPTETVTQLYGEDLPQTHHMGVFTLNETIDKIYVKNRFGKNGYLFKVGVSNLLEGDDPECLDYNPLLHGYTNDNYCTMGVEAVDPISRADWLGEEHILDQDYVNSFIGYQGMPQPQFVPYRPTFDLKTKKDEIVEARTELNALIAVISSEPTLEELAAVFDIDSFIRAQAVDIVTGAVDHYVRIANNYYIYQHPNTKKWYYLTYDYDFSFRNNHPASWGNFDSPVFDGVIASTIFTESGNRWNDSNFGFEPALYNIIFADEENREQLLAQVKELRTAWLDWEYRIKPMTDVWFDKIEPEISAMTATDSFPDTTFNRDAATGESYNMAEGGSSTDTLKNYIQGRSATLATEAP